MLVNVGNYILNSLDLLSSLIRNLNVEFLFESHDQLNDIQGVSAQIIDEGRIDCDLVRLNAQLLNNDISNFSKVDMKFHLLKLVSYIVISHNHAAVYIDDLTSDIG